MEQLTAKQIQAKINEGSAFNIIDIRQKERYDAFHLEGAVHFEKGLMFEKGEELLDKEKEYYITCNSGNSASMIASQLQAKGFKIKSIEKGMSTLM